MKYISLILLLILLTWTWHLSTSDGEMSLEQHKHVENGVEQDVKAFIQRKYPQTSSINCAKLYTEEGTNADELVARFSCEAVGPTAGGDIANQVFEGHLNLKSQDGFETWSETGGEILSPQVSFQNGSHISARDQTPEAQPSPAEAPAHDGH